MSSVSHAQHRPDDAAGGENHRAALVDHRSGVRCHHRVWRMASSRRIFSRLPDGFFHGMAGNNSGIDGDSHAPPSQPKAAWGMVIRRILGAAMRCVPPDGGAVHPAFYLEFADSISGPGRWMPLRTSICASTCRTSPRLILRSMDLLFAPRSTSPSGTCCRFSLPGGRRNKTTRRCATTVGAFKALSGPGLILLRLHYHVCRYRLDHVDRPQLDFHDLRPVVS